MNERFDKLCADYTERLVQDLVRFGQPEHNARDLAQEALLATWKHLDGIAPGAEWSYLRTAARRLTINDVQRDRLNGCAALDDTHRDRVTSAEERLVHRGEVAEFRKRFDAAMAGLPEESRLYVVLRRRGLTPKQIAEQLGVSRTAVRTRLMRATHHLRARAGPPPEGVEWAELTGEDE